MSNKGLMMKAFFIAGLALILFGCGAPTDFNKVGESTGSYKVVCMNGVKYYENPRTLAVVYGTDGQVALCN